MARRHVTSYKPNLVLLTEAQFDKVVIKCWASTLSKALGLLSELGSRCEYEDLT